MSVQRKTDILFSGIFILGVSIVLLGTLVNPKSNMSIRENRKLKTLPAIGRTPFSQLPGEMTEYLADHFFGRERLLDIFSSLKLKILGLSPTDRVVLGNNGWYFYSPHLSDGYRGGLQATDEVIKRTVHYLNRFQEDLSLRGIELYFLLVPTSPSIYSEYLPQAYVKAEPLQTKRALISAMKADSTIRVIDPYDAMMVEKRRNHGELLYIKGDHHWSHKAGYIAYKEVIRVFNRDGGHRFAVNQPEWIVGPTGNRSLLLNLGLADTPKELVPMAVWPKEIDAHLFSKKKTLSYGFTGRDWAVPRTFINEDSDSGKRLLLAGNSYMYHFLGDALVRNYYETTYTPVYDLGPTLMYVDDLAVKPDVFLIQITDAKIKALYVSLKRMYQ